jgi:predicted ATP-dependent endonuclease of OLD family
LKFKIRNYRKISHAHIEVNSITCVAGKGMAGKSSALGAISSIMTGLTNPYGDIKKKHMSRMVHSGTSSGKIELKDDKTDLSAEIIWPDCKYSASSNHKLISPIVAGFKSIIDMNYS